jgi:hypothetical protein
MHFIWNLWRNAGYTKIDSFTRLNGDSAQQVEAAITDGRAFVVFRGQGVTNWWAPFAIVPSRTNNGFKLPIVISGTCATINLASTGGSYLGESFLKVGSTSTPQGAVGFFGTTNSTSGPGIAELRGVVSVNFFKTLFSENNYKMGDATKRAKFLIDSIRPPYYSSTFYREWNLLGDPELNIWTATPKTMSVVFDSVMPLNTSNILISVTSNGNPIGNACVCLMKDSTTYQTGYTQSNGIINIPVSLSSTGLMNITVTAENCQPFEGTISIINAGVEESSRFKVQSSKVRIMPNPCLNEAVIYHSQTLEKENIKIYNIQGSKVDSKIERLEDTKIKINLKKLPCGIYLVYNRGRIIGKIIKQ